MVRKISIMACLLAVACSAPQSQVNSQHAIPSNMYPVKPVEKSAAPPVQHNPKPAELQIGKGSFFSYALPQGWKILEDGQYALTMAAPDQQAFTVMVGNSGLPLNYPPGQYAYERMMGIRPENLQLTNPRQTQPVAGFSYAYAFDAVYYIQGVQCKGLVKCHVAPSYDFCVMAMTAAIATADQWASYSSWLPLVADQLSAHSGAAFGMRGLMQQNLQNSMAYAEAARQYRDWSQRNWQQVTDDRNQSVTRQNEQFRENLGGVQSYINPYEPNKYVELPTTYQYYWIDLQGNVLGTDDPGANPNAGDTREWSPMKSRF